MAIELGGVYALYANSTNWDGTSLGGATKCRVLCGADDDGDHSVELLDGMRSELPAAVNSRMLGGLIAPYSDRVGQWVRICITAPLGQLRGERVLVVRDIKAADVFTRFLTVQGEDGLEVRVRESMLEFEEVDENADPTDSVATVDLVALMDRY